MVRTQIQLSEKQSREVKRRARQRGISTAEYIRRAVDESLRSETTPDYDELVKRSLATLGSFHSGVGDISVRHDDYFAESILE